MKKSCIFIFCCLLLFFSNLGSVDVSAKANCKARITKKEQSRFWVKNRSLNLHIEDREKIKLSYSNLKKYKIRFRSMNKKVATVNRKGVVTGKHPGKTIIKIYDQKKRVRKCKVKVTQGYLLSFPIERMELVIGQSINNQAILSRASDETIFYESSDEKIAIVDNQGNITAKGAGQAIITAEGIQAKAQCIVTVVADIYSDMATFTAHRGYCEDDKYKENTMDAFANAIQCGFKGIETDIRVTADGEFVLSHDDCIWKRVYTCPGDITDSVERRGNISMLTYEQLYRLTDGKIVKLSDYLDYIKGKNVHSYLEIKELIASNYPTAEQVANETGVNLIQKQQAYQVKKLLDMIYSRGMVDQVTISSFVSGYLELTRSIDKTIAIQYTIEKRDIDVNYLKKYNFGVDTPLWWVSSEVMKHYKENGIRVGVYCADTKEQMLRAMYLQPDNIMSNKCLFKQR